MAFTPHPDLKDIPPGPIAWMAGHPVAANLLMIIFLMGGLFFFSQSTKEVFPEFALDTITVSMSYPGASPEEVEQGIVLAIEDALTDIDGLGEITSTARESSGSVTAEVLDIDEMIRIAQDAKSAVDRITTFPVEAEDLKVSVNNRRRDVISLALYGEVDAWTLRAAAEQIQERLEEDKNIGPVELSGARNYEIHIEIPQENLRRYGISLPTVAQIIRNTALELGGGSLDTESGEILVRMSERRNTAKEFRNIPIITQENGSKVFLGDIATISDGFDDSNNYAFYNGKPAILFDVYRIGKQTPTGVATAVKTQVTELNQSLPGGLTITTFNDRSRLFEQRAELLMTNGLFGLILVVTFLALFLDVRLAFWVSMGIPISFMGAFLLFPATDFTVNIVSMFAFIISLGIVVDDAIVSGENIYHYRQKGLTPLRAAVEGAREIATPITISVLTNMVAFVPLFFVPGHMGKVFSVIPEVVILVFFISLIESLFILPAHLTFKQVSTRSPHNLLQHIAARQKGFNQRFNHFVENQYAPFLQNHVLKHRYLALAVFISILLIAGGYVFSGRMGMTLFPRVESDYAFASAELKVGSPFSQTKEVADRLMHAAQDVIDQHGSEQLAEGIFTDIEENVVEMRIFLTEPEVRPITTAEFTKLWREALGEIPGLEALSLMSNRGGPGSGAALTVELSHHDTAVLDKAAVQLAGALADFPNTKDIDDGSAQGKKQFDFTMKELGYTLGMTTADVARQVRAAFYGSEAFKQQRGRNEVRVLVRLPEEQRSSQYYLKNLMIKTPDGSDVMLRDLVHMTEGRAYTTINRRDSRRVIQVQADVDPPSEANAVIAAIMKDTLSELQQRYPRLSYSFEGSQAEIRDSVHSLFFGLGAVLFVIYALLAILFSSYSQPFMVLVAIPFGTVGAIIGHLIMGYSLSVMSLFGMMALAGVVVNDSLLLVDFANRKRVKGMHAVQAVIEAGTQRFRPILLTTMTTFMGLAPMILETSRQARFLIPMALSLGFGILFATLLTLILVPALYMIIEDIKALWQNLLKRSH
ncbi:MAG: efflux RND transporter permease subunit [Hyphomicrobiales bacterium]|nr:efflux RND transporter permease subunit [Hyphomicrobiales bacterium]